MREYICSWMKVQKVSRPNSSGALKLCTEENLPEVDQSEHRLPLLTQPPRVCTPWDFLCSSRVIIALLLNHEIPLSLCINVAGHELWRIRDKNQIYLVKVVVQITSFLSYTTFCPKEGIQNKRPCMAKYFSLLWLQREKKETSSVVDLYIWSD